MHKSIEKLRKLAKEEINKRLKMKEENIDLPNDMLTIFLKEKSINNKILNRKLKYLFEK